MEIIQPTFSIVPFQDFDTMPVVGGLKSAEVVIENLPYAYAVPMLAGWDIGYTTDDQHVKELGIWLDDLQFERPPGSATGRLRYKVHSILKDNNDDPPNYFAHKVTVLGLKPTGVTARP